LAKAVNLDSLNSKLLDSLIMVEIADKKWITSKEVLLKTGISRATLNNYIKMGILPGPVVKKAGPEMKGTKHIGFFPESVLHHIEMVKQLKREGNAMEKIAMHFKDNAAVVEIFPQPKISQQTTPKTAPGSGPSERRFGKHDGYQIRREEINGRRKVTPRILDKHKSLTLTINEMHIPAYLVNHNFEIEWINSEAENLIFNRVVSSITDSESRNIFKLFFSSEFHSNLDNWKEIISHHMPFVRSNFAKGEITTLYQGIPESEVLFLQDLYEETMVFDRKTISSFPGKLVLKDGRIEYFQIYYMLFREGIFFVYVPTDRISNDIIEYLSKREMIINELLKHRMPALVSLCVLVADLQDSVKISAELLPGEYFSLINDLWESLAGCFDKYGGIYGKHAGDGMLYYFIKKPGTDYVMNAINCALELRDRMREFSADWKIKKCWFEDMYLNVGINEGQEFFGTIRSAPTIEFTALGDSINYAGRLSDFARYGEIWATKSVIGKLDPEEVKRIQFGVNRTIQGRDHYIPNAFSRIIDLMGRDDKNYGKYIDIATLPITKIMDKVRNE